MTFSLAFFGIIWISFQLVYKKELLIQNMYRSNEPPDTLQVVMLYNKMVKSALKHKEIDLYYRLSEILMRIGKKKEAVKVLNRLLKTVPEDRSLRLSLAIELHNQKRYKEAEKHFVVLLRENRKDLSRKYQEYQ